MTDTQIAAYIQIQESGAAENIAQHMCEVYQANGPLADFEIGKLMNNTSTCLLARRRELNKADVVGIMPYERENPETGQQCIVWGLRKEHGARRYWPDDLISVRVHGITRTMKIGDLMNVDVIELVPLLRTMFDELYVEIREREVNDTRRQGQETL